MKSVQRYSKCTCTHKGKNVFQVKMISNWSVLCLRNMVRKLEQRNIQIKLVQNHIDLNFIGGDFVGDDLTKVIVVSFILKCL